MNNPPKKNRRPENAPPDKLLEQFLDLQYRELEVKNREIELDSQREKNNKAVAEASIQANLQDRENHRSHMKQAASQNLLCLCFLFSVFAGVVVYCLYLGKEGLLMKGLEVVSLLVAGFLGGYGYKASKVNQEMHQPDKNIDS